MCVTLHVGVWVVHTEKGAGEARTNKRMSTWYPVPVLNTYLFAPRLTGLLEKIAPSCRVSPSVFLPPLCCFRQATQDAPEEVRNRDFRRELEERERVAAREKSRDRPTRGKTKETKILMLLCGIALA